MSRSATRLLSTAVAIATCAGSASAQLLGGIGLPPVGIPSVGSLPVAGPALRTVLGSGEMRDQVVQPTLDHVTGLPPHVAEAGATTLAELRRLRLKELIESSSAELEQGEDGQPVRRGVLLALDPDPLSLQQAMRQGFRIARDSIDPELGIRTVMLGVPRGMSVRVAKRRLSRAAPQLQADYDHIFEPAGGPLATVTTALASLPASGRGQVIGMIDGGVASHPSLAGAAIEQNGFAGPPKPTGHGTAVASLLVGNKSPFRAPAAGAQLFVADVYGGSRAAGSASAIVRALGWLASHRPRVVNISLVGPPNVAVRRAIEAIQRRGIRVVAAVGNDGPAAPPQYPASYPGVLAVTGVDARGRALPEAGRAAHLDFAAPGADMAAAFPGRGYARVRGTSFAAPLAAARLLFAGSPELLANEARRGSGRVGRGIVCFACRIDPKTVGAK